MKDPKSFVSQFRNSHIYFGDDAIEVNSHMAILIGNTINPLKTSIKSIYDLKIPFYNTYESAWKQL